MPPWLLFAAAIPVFLICLPLAYVALRSGQAGPAGIIAELGRQRTLDLLLNTLVIALGVTVASSLIGVVGAWCIERSDLPGRKWWRIVVTLPLAVPAFVASYAWSSIDGAFESMPGAIFILTLSAYPLVLLPVAAALRSADPGFEDVSRSLGRGPWATFFGAVLPQIRPALAAGALLVLTHTLSEFGALALLRVQTFTTSIFASYELQFDNATAALQSAVLMALCLPAAYGEMRLRLKTQVARVGKGSRRHAPLAALGPIRWPVALALGALVVLALGVPTGTLVYWLRVGSSAGHGRGEIWDAIGGSFSLALPGAAIVVLFALPLVLASSRHGGRLAQIADRLPYIVHGLPGLVVALALVFLSIRFAHPLYQTVVLVFVAYTMMFLPLAQSALRGPVELAPARLEEMARGLGRSPFGAFASITLPAIAPGIGAALALLALELMRELTATLMLAPSGTVTLATAVWGHTTDGEYAAAAPFAALLVAASALPVYFFTRRTLELYEL
ncbi:ABC transporter permease [Flaviflagellibacter deserti]|uniref:ABC transporter permease n=1 Tax=Flaviflagellibacter deserti TaxID=2267266 RepID=A0ABV9Z076_9HYPH